MSTDLENQNAHAKLTVTGAFHAGRDAAVSLVRKRAAEQFLAGLDREAIAFSALAAEIATLELADE